MLCHLVPVLPMRQILYKSQKGDSYIKEIQFDWKRQVAFLNKCVCFKSFRKTE
jgi:hypothetical protein